MYQIILPDPPVTLNLNTTTRKNIPETHRSQLRFLPYTGKRLLARKHLTIGTIFEEIRARICGTRAVLNTGIIAVEELDTI